MLSRSNALASTQSVMYELDWPRESPWQPGFYTSVLSRHESSIFHLSCSNIAEGWGRMTRLQLLAHEVIDSLLNGGELGHGTKMRIVSFRHCQRLDSPHMRLSASLGALMLSVVCCLAGTVEDYARNIAPLIEPAKLGTLGPRGANQRVQKVTYWLAMAKKEKRSTSSVAWQAVLLAGYTNKDAQALTKAAMVRNLSIAQKLGSLDEAGLAEMRKGNAATVKRGPYAGDQLSVDHIIPRAVVPELDNVIANLELMPLRMNESKSAKIGSRQRSLAAKLEKAGLLSEAGLRAVRESR